MISSNGFERGCRNRRLIGKISLAYHWVHSAVANLFSATHYAIIWHSWLRSWQVFLPILQTDITSEGFSGLESFVFLLSFFLPRSFFSGIGIVFVSGNSSAISSWYKRISEDFLDTPSSFHPISFHHLPYLHPTCPTTQKIPHKTLYPDLLLVKVSILDR